MASTENIIVRYFEKFISNRKNIIYLLAVIYLGTTIQGVLAGPNLLDVGQGEMIRVDNYGVFKQSFYNLIEGKDLYLEKHKGYYKYTPTFALFFGAFALLPDWLGLLLWNLVNVAVLAFAIYYLPWPDLKKKNLAIVIFAMELVTALQHQQSNALIAGLLILAFGLLENKKYLPAVLCIVFSAYIKLFGVTDFALLLFYPRKVRSFFYGASLMALFAILPLIIVNVEHLQFLYTSYAKLLVQDHVKSYGYSVMGLLHSWFSIDANKYLVVAAGTVIFLIPFIKFKEYASYPFRMLTLASLLIWVVIFNHRAGSDIFILSMSGIALWYVIAPKSKTNTILLVLALIFTSFSPTDLFPRFLRDEFVTPLMLRGVFPIFIWFKLIYDMLVHDSQKQGDHLSVNGANLTS